MGSGGLPEVSWSQLRRRYQIFHARPLLFGGLLGTILAPKSDFWALFWNPFFYLFLISLLGGLRRQFGRNLESFWGPVGGQFAHFFAIAAKLQKCNPSQAKCLFLVVPGVHFGIIFVNFLKLFLVLLSGLHFCHILADFGLQVGSLLELIFADFANLA